jgi:hypothetical protein
LLEVIGDDCVFPTVDAAVRHIEAETGSRVLPPAVAPPEWWAEARIPLDDAGTPAS